MKIDDNFDGAEADVSNASHILFTLQILHASDQEAGVPALVDILGFSAVFNALLDDGFDNTLRLTSGDTFIQSPFSNASQDVYRIVEDNRVLPGFGAIGDILIQNELYWDAVAIGNHEFGFGPDGLARVLSPDERVRGPGIDDDLGYLGSLAPYLALNLDFQTQSNLAPLEVEGPIEIDQDGVPDAPNTVSSSVIVDVNGHSVGVLAAVTPYLNDIAGIGSLEVTTRLPNGEEISNQVPADVQAEQLLPEIAAEVALLEAAGIDKIILMTHLQEAPIEQALAQQLADADINVDVLIGGGSHQIMANPDDPLREDETQQATLLEPYPQIFEGADQRVLYVNTAANYRYVSQLVVTFDETGDIIEIGEESGTFATDLAGVQNLYGEDVVMSTDDFAALADPEIVEIVDAIGDFIRVQDGNIFGQAEVFLNGLRASVRTEETNLGNLTQDATRWYVDQYLQAANEPGSGVELPEGAPDAIHIALGNGGGIRDYIGENRIPGGGGELVQGPTTPNPDVGKEAGDISQLDISNSLRFNNDLVFGTVTAEDLLALVEHGVSAGESDGALQQNGRFGQWGGLTFAFDATLPARDRVQELKILDEDGSVMDIVVENGELVGDPDRTFGITSSGFTANGGDSYPQVIENRTSLLDLVEDLDPEMLGRSDLPEGRQQDAVAEYLAAFFNNENAQDPFSEADAPASQDQRIVQLALQEPPVELTPIYELQGASQVSPLVLEEVGSLTASSFFANIRNGVDFPNGQPTRLAEQRLFNIEGPEVTTVGVVTAIDRDSQGRAQGFYLQDADGDGDIATSDAILVFTGRTLFPEDVAVGDELQVSGQVQERFNGDTASRERPVSRISVNEAANIVILSTGNDLPDATLIGTNGRVPPERNIEDDRFIAYDPETSGLDFWESLEGMLITIEDAMSVTGLTRNDNFWVVPNQGAEATGLSPRNTLTIREGDFNPEDLRVQLPSGSEAPRINAGDTLGDLTGVLGFGFGQDQLLPIGDPFADYEASGLTADVTEIRGDANTLTVATYNVFNLDPNDSDRGPDGSPVGDRDITEFRYLTLARHIVVNLGTPDIVALQEIQDNSGQVNDGVTAADETLRQLVRSIDFVDDGEINNSLVYEFIDTPNVENNRNGGAAGSNIRNAFIYNTARVDLVEDSVETIGSQDAGQPNFASRLPLIADFAFNGETVTLINIHNSAKTGSAPLLGIDQAFDARQEDPTINSRVDQRADQMAVVADFVQRELQADPDAKIVALGDFNEFQFVSPAEGLKAAGLNDLGDLLPPEERYTFVFNGNAQQIDHIFVTDALAMNAEADIVNVNTDLFDNVERRNVVDGDGQTRSVIVDFRGSDHDPMVARLNLSPTPMRNFVEGTDHNDRLAGTEGADWMEGLAGNDRLFGDEGDDVLIGGLGNDRLFGDEGDDVLIGGPGNDRLFGDEGDDELTGGAGDDRLFGGQGMDTAFYPDLEREELTFRGTPDFLRVSGAGIGTDLLHEVEFIRTASELLAVDDALFV